MAPLTPHEEMLFRTLTEDEYEYLRNSLEIPTEGIRTEIKNNRELLMEVLKIRNEQVILNGQKATLLSGNQYNQEGMKYFVTAEGVQIWAATDKGINYKEINEDRVVIDTEHHIFVGVDGMGGQSDGEAAADAVATGMMKRIESARAGMEEAQNIMRQRNLNTDAGACFHRVELTFDENHHVFCNAQQAGDVHLLILNEDNSKDMESADENLADSYAAIGRITPDEALYNRYRNVVLNYVGPSTGDIHITLTNKPMRTGQKILIYSDGITDNFTSYELVAMLQGKKTEEFIHIINEATAKRMANLDTLIADSDRETNGMYADGFKAKPKTDNRALIVIEIP